MSRLNFLDLDIYLQNQNSRIMHQVWFGTIPNKREAKKAYEKLKIYRDSWKLKNPTWCHIEWDKKMCKNLVQHFFPEHAEMLSKYKHEIQRCDLVRYLILYRYGGFYVDMDYYCCKPFDQVLEKYQDDLYFVQSPNSFMQESDHISNSLMYSVKGHCFWKKLLIELEKHQTCPMYYPKHLQVMFTTGPGILNRIYSKYKYTYKLKSYPWRLFHPYGITDDKLSLIRDDVYAIHIGKGSWESKDSKFLLTIVREWKICLFVICVYLLYILILWLRK